jgi:lipid II:glycine glycyltransferase (peptidoglycan interpeptide bridge formation enzyme)
MIKISLININSSRGLLKDYMLNSFQEPFWWEIIEDGFGKNCKIALVSDNGKHKLLIPLFFHKFGPFLRVGSPLRGTHTSHINPIIISEDVDINSQKKYIHEVFQFLLKFGADWIELTFENHKMLNGLNEVNFLIEYPLTSILKTNLDEDSLWKGMQGRSRNLVRKAQKNNLTIKFLDSSMDNIDIFYDMLKETFKKSRTNPPHSKEFYAFLICTLIASNNLLFLSVEKESKNVSMGLFMFNNNEINFISGTSSPLGNKYGANNLMHWEVIRYASTHNIKQYNFGGLGIPSIDNFKRSFGGNDVEYRRFIWMKPLVKVLFNFLIKMRNFLPQTRQFFNRKK